MPHVPSQLLDCAFYLYRNQEAAERGEQRGGSGFFVGVPSGVDSQAAHVYGVSCKHVVHQDGHSAVRLNTIDGGIDVLPYEPHEWIAHPAGDDIAVVPMSIADSHKVVYLHTELFVTRGADIGPGDDLVMIGRFVNHEGKQQNQPSVRFGNVSIGLAPIRLPNGYMQESYGVEMRSMGGYSGSPVIAYHSPFSRMGGPLIVTGRVDIFLLGVNWGFITDDWEITRRKVTVPALSGTALEREAEFVRANTGMNGVVPAWKIMDVLDLPALKQMRAQEDAEYKKRLDQQRGGTEFANDK